MSHIDHFFKRLSDVKTLNEKRGVNRPYPDDEIISSLIKLFWAAEMAEEEIRELLTKKPRGTVAAPAGDGETTR